MKKIFILFLIVLLGYGYWFYYNNLRGVRPAIMPAKSGIVNSVNNTGLPLTIPSGFSISIFARDLVNPRVLALDPKGVLLVSIPSQGKVVALPDKNNDGIADKETTVISGLNKPHGLAFNPMTKKLYIAETDQVAVYDYDQAAYQALNKKKLIDLPGGSNHFSRTIGFGPDGRLYVAIGSSCNACLEKDWRRAKILVANADGSNFKEYATGLRNSVFFTWHPVTKDLWATDMGRDLIGDDLPPDEVNIIKEGRFYGWPYCYGKNIGDSTFEKMEICRLAEPSHIDLPAHSAPLGLAFIAKSVNLIATALKKTVYGTWPEEYQGDLLVAYHGSWNRSTPTGYKVVRIKIDDRGSYLGTEDFITGWFPPAGGSSESALGRPADLLFDDQGTLYISDDKAGVIYRFVKQY